MRGVGGLLKEHCEQAAGGVMTSLQLAGRLREVGYKCTSSYIRGVFTGKSKASYDLLEACEKVLNLAAGELTRFAVGHVAEQLADRHNLSVYRVAHLLKEYLRGIGAVSAAGETPSLAPGEVGTRPAASPGKEQVTHKRTIRSLMSTLAGVNAHFYWRLPLVSEALSPRG